MRALILRTLWWKLPFLPHWQPHQMLFSILSETFVNHWWICFFLASLLNKVKKQLISSLTSRSFCLKKTWWVNIYVIFSHCMRVSQPWCWQRHGRLFPLPGWSTPPSCSHSKCPHWSEGQAHLRLWSTFLPKLSSGRMCGQSWVIQLPATCLPMHNAYKGK